MTGVSDMLRTRQPGLLWALLAAALVALLPMAVQAQGLAVAGLPVVPAGANPVGAANPVAAANLAVIDRADPSLAGTIATAPALFTGSSDRQRAVDCMTAAIAYEAGNQPVQGQEAVAQVILNRMRHPRFPKTVCGVVFSGSDRTTGCQFTFTCDGSLYRRLRAETFATARAVALSVIDGISPDRVHGATHYHADYVLPYWAATGTAVAKIGAHIFYRMPGDGGPGAGDPVLTSGEPSVALLSRVVSRQPRRPVQAVVRSAAPVARSLFAPWGLPVNGLAANASNPGGGLATAGLRPAGLGLHP
ncbi:cell wall hydrolase [Novosphingobium sp. FKTRR1]|uniref:cell wall hydrolase n=1 Tax=Novosphingobium sp. FKTRR1 TaxID=2879118 RepID=UPI001CF06E55|nr:cell wall hydrolase [Novosphingobium sp. FKTRR1]